ncbi:XRE family transcriptional regulator, partial [Streptococcus sp. GMD6S]
LTFVLLIASAVAINKVLKTKQRYLDKVIGLETPSDNDDSTKPGIT